jgi:hypothetical protein
MRKYGKDSFEVSVIEEVCTLEELDCREKYWIAELGTLHPGGYNLTEGGDSNPMDNPVSFKKHSLSMSSQKVRNNISNGLKAYIAEHPEKWAGRTPWNKGLTKAEMAEYPRDPNKHHSKHKHTYHLIDGHLHPEHQRIVVESRYKKYRCILPNGEKKDFYSGKEASLFWARYLGSEREDNSGLYKHYLKYIRRLIASGDKVKGCIWVGGTHKDLN